MMKIEEVLNNIRICRKSKDISHEDMAFRLGISQATYTNIENRISKLSVERLILIAEILEQPISDFFNEESNKEKDIINVRNLSKELVNELSKDAQINLLKILLEKN